MSAIHLRTNAWFGDDPLTIDCPKSWQVVEAAPADCPALTVDQLRSRLAGPIGARRVSDLARTRSRAAIVMDDLTRPTPGADLLPLLIEELQRGGMPATSIMVLVAGGTHPPDAPDALAKKVGARTARAVKVVAHDCHGDLVDLGRSPAGLPLQINRALMSCDLKIGVGCIYPHPVAGFSGGAKIILPAVCGPETTRGMHDYLRGSRERGGATDTELRRDMVAVARMVGLDFIANVVLSRDRRICGLYAGDCVLAHEEGVRAARTLYRAPVMSDAEIVIADMYPFDTSWQFAHDRGLWPFLHVSPTVSRVVIAACPLGVGTHDLFPVESPLWSRVRRRLRHFRVADVRWPVEKLRTVVRLIRERTQPLMVLSAGLKSGDLARVLPHAQVFNDWNELRVELQSRHSGTRVKVGLYRCAPLLLPFTENREAEIVPIVDSEGLAEGTSDGQAAAASTSLSRGRAWTRPS